MSTRTIIEINHDYINQEDNAPFTEEVLVKLIQHLVTGKKWEDGEIPGIRWLAERHHSEDILLVVN
jgi:hypothetical protein